MSTPLERARTFHNPTSGIFIAYILGISKVGKVDEVYYHGKDATKRPLGYHPVKRSNLVYYKIGWKK